MYVYTPSITFVGVPADSVTVNSASSITAVWLNGVPVSSTATSPILYFTSTSSVITHWASSVAKL